MLGLRLSPTLTVGLTGLLSHGTAVVPVVPLLLLPPSNLLVDVHVSVAGLELCLRSLFSPSAHEIQYLLSAPGWSVLLAWLVGELHSTVESC